MEPRSQFLLLPGWLSRVSTAVFPSSLSPFDFFLWNEAKTQLVQCPTPANPTELCALSTRVSHRTWALDVFEQHRHSKPHRAAHRHSAKHVINNTHVTLHGTLHIHRQHHRLRPHTFLLQMPPSSPLLDPQKAPGPISLPKNPKMALGPRFFYDRAAKGGERDVKMRKPIFEKEKHFCDVQLSSCTFPSCHLRMLSPKLPKSEAVTPRYA